MIPTSPEYQRTVVRSHTAVFECDVEYNNRVVGSLPIHSGSVSVDARRQVRRTMTARLADPKGTFIPKGGADLLNPTVGALLRPKRGVLIQEVTRVSRLYNTAASWSAGTLSDVVTTADGGLTLLSPTSGVVYADRPGYLLAANLESAYSIDTAFTGRSGVARAANVGQTLVINP